MESYGFRNSSGNIHRKPPRLIFGEELGSRFHKKASGDECWG
jgi:hypothetical protein